MQSRGGRRQADLVEGDRDRDSCRPQPERAAVGWTNGDTVVDRAVAVATKRGELE
ncbi:hypothetical protein [uncultured Corynebacterium sp.]|uniref:hypothetical protein n=1 Tax=uncultured Corynebacterium sp. TaxID=159447 RepID=UPI0025932BD9|nr:hypothetical protein [uncultured Corynebacterium sp.]